VSQQAITAEFCGYWDSFSKDGKRLTCWNLTEDIAQHPAGSTVSSLTLERFGFFVPEQSDKEGFEAGKFYELRRT
jgi:hypothetical protein